jgi:PAS domain S-box-containing protein
MNTKTNYSEKVDKDISNMNFRDIFDLDEIQDILDLFSETNNINCSLLYNEGTLHSKLFNRCNLCNFRECKEFSSLIFEGEEDAFLREQVIVHEINIRKCGLEGVCYAEVCITLKEMHIASLIAGPISDISYNIPAYHNNSQKSLSDNFNSQPVEVPSISLDLLTKKSRLLSLLLSSLFNNAILNFEINADRKGKKNTYDYLKESEERYKSFLSQVSEGVYRLEANIPLDLSLPTEEKIDFVYYNFHLAECNTSFSKIYDADDSDELIGKGYLDLHDGRNNDINRNFLREFFEKGCKIENGITERINNKGEKLYLSNNSQGVIQNNYLLRIWGTQNNITDKVLAERDLIESKEKYRILTESIKDVVWILDAETMRFKYVSPSVERLRGFTPEEIIAEPMTKALTPEAAEYVYSLTKKRIDAVLSGETGPDNFYTEIVPQPCKDGSIVWTEVITSFYLNPENGRVEVRGVTRDISERMEAEKVLRTNKILLEQTFEQSPIPMVLVSMPDAVIRIANPACLEFLGMADEPSAINLPLGDLQASFKDYDVNGKLGTTWDLPLARALMGQKTNGEERYIVRKDGSIRNELVFGSPIYDDKENIIAGYLIMLDITQRKADEKKLKENEEKHRTLFSSMTEMIVIHELVFDEANLPINYRIVDANDAFTRVTGIKKEDAIGKLATEVYQTPVAPYLEIFANVGITGISYEYDTYYEPMDKYFLISVVSPKKNHFATITMDITTINQIQQVLSAKNKELENYLYVASHDLRSPLVNIQGFSQRLQKQIDSLRLFSEEIKVELDVKDRIGNLININIPKTLEFIFSNVQKMDSLINGLLQISRSGRIKMTIINVNMNQLMNSIFGGLNFQMSEISAKISCEDLPNCYGDENQLNQLFSNIIGNSIKYRDKNRQLQIGISGQIQFNKVIYCIKDNGIGIAAKHLERIWDVFYRVNSASNEQGEGLGLSLAKRIVEKHRGRIWAESIEESGSTFYVELMKSKFSEDLI